MARVPLRLYDQRSGARGARRPTIRSVDVGTDEARGLAQAAAALQGHLNADLAVEEAELRKRQILLQEEEEDGRIHAASAIARYRADASAARRSVLENAPDGFRGALETTRQRLGELRARYVQEAGAISPSAQRFVEEDIARYEPLFLEETAQEESRLRLSWQMDAARSAIDRAGAIIAQDPREYEEVRALQREALLPGIRDANARRDLEAVLEETLAIAAVSSLADRDPHVVLRATAPGMELEGPFQFLNGAQILQARNAAENEIQRREARARAQFAGELDAQERLIEAGLPVPNPIPVERVRAVLGPEAARAWDLTLRSSAEHSGLAGLDSRALHAIRNRPPPAQSDGVEAIQNDAARRRAAERILRQREEDPRGYLVNQGFAYENQFVDALDRALGETGEFAEVTQALRLRAGEAREGARRFGMPVAVLSAGEAREVAGRVAGMSSTQRMAFYRAASNALGEGEAYRSFVEQTLPASPGARAAAHWMGTGRGEQAAQVLMRGSELRAMGGGEGGGRRFDLGPDDAEERLARYWRTHVGADDRNVYQGDAEAEAEGYEAFLSAYAALKEQGGFHAFNRGAAARAATMATGHIWNQGSVRTLVPYGHTPESVERAFRAAWPAMQRAYPGLEEFSDYDFRIAGQAEDGSTLYSVMEGDNPVRDANQRPVRIRIRPHARNR